jgi:hypothetical protein
MQRRWGRPGAATPRSTTVNRGASRTTNPAGRQLTVIGRDRAVGPYMGIQGVGHLTTPTSHPVGRCDGRSATVAREMPVDGGPADPKRGGDRGHGVLP